MIRPNVSCRPFMFLVLVLLFCCTRATASAETWEPVSTGFNTEIRIWTSGGNAFAEVRLTFPNTGYRVTDWGEVARTDSDFSVDAKVERWTGISGQAITTLEHTYAFGALTPGAYSFTFKSHRVVIKSQQFDPSTAGERWEPASPTAVRVGISIWTTAGITYTEVELYFPDTGHRVTDWGQVMRAGNELSVDIRAERWTGESEARVTLTEQTYQLGALAPGPYSFTVKINGSVARRQQFSIGAASPPAPRLLTEGNAERAIALESPTWMRDSFTVIATPNFSLDRRTRITLFATDVELGQGDSISAITAQAEDSGHNTYPMAVEYVGKVPNQDWLTQLVIKLPAELQSSGDIWVSVNVRGVVSNRVLISIKPSGSGSP
jgi:uncharacterized protein (TIGR03437 family)